MGEIDRSQSTASPRETRHFYNYLGTLRNKVG
jgi:hypothetical protein